MYFFPKKKKSMFQFEQFNDRKGDHVLLSDRKFKKFGKEKHVLLPQYFTFQLMFQFGMANFQKGEHVLLSENKICKILFIINW